LVVRLNELTGRALNPHVPWTPEEIAREAAACVDAGATVVHFHGRTDAGAADPSGETLSRTLDLITEACDAVTYCTLGAGQDQDRDTRMATLTGAVTKPDIAPVDLGSFNLDPWDAEARRFVVEEGLYVNTVGTVRHLASGIQAEGVTPAAVAWTIGSLRLLGALLEEGTWRAPVFAELVVSDRLLVTNPATPLGVEHLVAHLPAGVGDWTLLCAGGSVLPLVDAAVTAGGGLAFGLGDHPYLELGDAPRNADVVAAVVDRLDQLGRRPATPKELREQLG
jgi:uncharacterized protein (DUF849 family)